MPKLGLFGGGQPQTPGASPAPPSQPIIGQNMFRRGPGGIFPERGSQAQYDMVQSLLASALSQAPNSGSPLVSFLAPLITGAVGSRTQGLYDQRIADEEQAEKDKAAAANQSAMDVLMGALGAPMSGGGTGGGQALPGGSNASRNAALKAFGGPTKAAADAIGNPERDILARTIQAEAGNQDLMGKLAVGSVIANRAGRGGYGDGIKGVIMKPGQFSAWNSVTGYAGGEQGQDMENMRPSPESYAAADAILSGNYKDPTGGATHYYNPSISNPKWGQARAGGQWNRIGDHIFGSTEAGWSPSGGGPQDALALANSLPAQPGPQRRAYTPEMQRGLMGIIGNENVPAGYRNLAVKMLTDSMAPPAAGPGLDDRIDTAQNLIDLQNSMSPKPPERKYATAPDGIPRYVDNGEPVYPGILPRDNQNDAGVMRQKNEATTIIADAVNAMELQGLSRQEAMAEIAKNPLYAAQLRILGINPDDLTRAKVIEESREKANSGGWFDGLFGGGDASGDDDGNDPLGIR